MIAHFGFPYFLETANIVSKNANVYTEISGTIDAVGDPDRLRLLVSQYVQDLDRAFAYFPNVRRKTMFGTDYAGEHTGLNQVDPYIDVVDRVFAPEERAHVTTELAQRLLLSV